MTTLTSDTPIFDPAQDKFNRWPFAQRIAQTIVSRKDKSSIVIGIYGSWGDGKTTVLNFIEQEINKNENAVCLKFNPWRFSDETEMLLGFYHDLANVIGKSEITTKEKLGKWVGKYLPAVGAAFGQGETVKIISELLSSVEIEERKDRVNELLGNAEKKIVILVDDIDRLDKNEIQFLFRFVKLNADFVNTAYILAFDDEMVAAALQEKYGSGGVESGRSFLEKIIQVPLDLPAIPSTSLRNYCFSKIDEAIRESNCSISQEEIQTFIREYTGGLEIRVKTPRIAARYGNIVSFSLPILIGEVNPVDLMIIEGVRLFYPRLYETIRRYPDLFLGKNLYTYHGNTEEQEKKRTRDLIETALFDLNNDEKSAAIKLMKSLFPRLQGVYGNVQYGPEWETTWAREKKITSQDYILRYLSYSITETDVSDAVLSSFLSSLEEKSKEEVIDIFITMVKGNNIEKIISKLRQRADQINCESSKKMSGLIASFGNIFPNPDQLFSFRGSFSQAAMLISDLLLNIPDRDERFDFSKHLLHVAEPVTFSLEIARWLRKEGDDGRSRGFSPEEFMELRKFLADRIRDICLSINIFTEFPNDAGQMLFFWATWGQNKDQSEYIATLLNENPAQVFTFFDNFVPTGWSETGSSKGDLDKSIYDIIGKVVSPTIIMEALEKIFGDDINIEEYPDEYSEKDSNKRFAQQFSWIQRSVKVEDQHEKENEVV